MGRFHGRSSWASRGIGINETEELTEIATNDGLSWSRITKLRFLWCNEGDRYFCAKLSAFNEPIWKEFAEYIWSADCRPSPSSKWIVVVPGNKSVRFTASEKCAKINTHTKINKNFDLFATIRFIYGLNDTFNLLFHQNISTNLPINCLKREIFLSSSTLSLIPSKYFQLRHHIVARTHDRFRMALWIALLCTRHFLAPLTQKGGTRWLSSY